jgi:hypothetical protein
MTYSPLRRRLATLLPELSDNNLNLALPAAIGGATGLGALAYNAVAPLDVDPVGLAVGAGLTLGTQGRTPYNYAGLAALGLEGARYLNNAFTNSRDTEASPLIAMGIGAGTLGLREALRRKVLTKADAGFPDTATRIAEPIEVATAPVGKSPNVEQPKTRTATESTVAPSGLTVPSPSNVYLARNLGVMSSGLSKKGVTNLGDYASETPARKAQLSYDSPTDYFDNLVDPEDLFKSYGLNTVVVNPSGMMVDRRLLENRTDLLNQPVVQITPSTLDAGHSELVRQGKAKAGQPHPNVRAYGTKTLDELALGSDTTPDALNPLGYYDKADNNNWRWDRNLDAEVASAVVKDKGGRIAYNMNTMKPLDTIEQNDLYLDAIGATGMGAYTPTSSPIPRQSSYYKQNKDGSLSKQPQKLAKPTRMAKQGDN